LREEKDSAMKCTLEVDCTPLEARQFFGLPDIQPLQATIMAEVEKKMLAEMDRFSPEGVLKSWLSMFGQSPEQFQQAFAKMMFNGSTRPKT
jgi:hypothetical protein